MPTEKRLPPVFIRVYEQAGGVNFDIVGEIDWADNPKETEYLAKTRVRVANLDEQLGKCEKAWRREGGIFFSYPGFKEGMRRNVRIVDASGVSVADETGTLLPVLELTVVLSEDDYQDATGRNDLENL